MITIIRKKNTIQYESKSVLMLRVSSSIGTWVQDFFVFNFINKTCIYNVYEPVWHASLWNRRHYELYPIFLIQCIYSIQGKNVEFVLKIATNVIADIPAVIRQKKIVSDDSWHIPGFLSTLSDCWTQKSLVAERLNG